MTLARDFLSSLPPQTILELAARRMRQIAADRQRVEPQADPVDWIERNFLVPELAGPLQLADYQRRALREALSRDESGRFRYSVIVWSDIKKSIKSTIAAAVALWRAYTLDWGSLIIVANDLKQADSRVGFYLRRAIELNPRMRAEAKIKNYLVELPNRTRIESVPIDPTGEAGANADAVIFSELWGSHNQAQQRMWAEMALPPQKFGQSFRWIETYAGYSGESPLLEQLYEQGVKHGRRLWDDTEAYANDAARMFCLWNTTPRLSWQTPEYYAQQATELLENEFRRIHRNEWVTSAQTFVPKEWWDACKADVPPLAKDEPIVLSADAGVSNDTFGLIAVSRETDIVSVRYSQKWAPPKGGTLDFAKPEVELERLCAEYNVIEVAYDPYQLHDMATRLRNKGLTYFRAFPQGADRLVADKQLYDVIRDKRIRHSGEPDLAEHIQNANAKTEGDKLRLVKRAEHMKIDLAVALSMATARILKMNW